VSTRYADSRPPVPAEGFTRRDLLSFGWGNDGDPGAEHWIRIHRRAMACRFEITLSGERASDIPAARDALDEAERLEALLSVFRDTSEISRVNDQAGIGAVTASDDVVTLLGRCQELSAATGGAFDITSTPLSRCWGFLRREGRLPADAEIDQALALVGMDALSCDPDTNRVSLSKRGAALNLGAIGKGFAVQAIGAALWRRGVRDALVSAGSSSVLAVGGRRDGWTVDVTVSGPARRVLARLRLRNAALGTSGAGEQFIEVDGRRYGHILDPRTGRPAAGVVNATVVTADATSADALATAFFVGGIDLARAYCDAHPGTLALITPDDQSWRPLVVGRYRGALVEDP
jgi:thiamine biosynthesis lipoprotein